VGVQSCRRVLHCYHAEGYFRCEASHQPSRTPARQSLRPTAGNIKREVQHCFVYRKGVVLVYNSSLGAWRLRMSRSWCDSQGSASIGNGEGLTSTSNTSVAPPGILPPAPASPSIRQSHELGQWKTKQKERTSKSGGNAQLALLADAHAAWQSQRSRRFMRGWRICTPEGPGPSP
jgi:hypothetical protein